jgi:hypothetical protein
MEFGLAALCHMFASALVLGILGRITEEFLTLFWVLLQPVQQQLCPIHIPDNSMRLCTLARLKFTIGGISAYRIGSSL